MYTWRCTEGCKNMDEMMLGEPAENSGITKPSQKEGRPRHENNTPAGAMTRTR